MAEDKIAIRLEKVESLSELNDQRLSNLEIDIKDLHETHLSLLKISNGMQEMNRLIEQQIKEEKVIEIKEQPKSNLVEAVLDRTMWVIIGGAIAYLLSHLLGGA